MEKKKNRKSLNKLNKIEKLIIQTIDKNGGWLTTTEIAHLSGLSWVTVKKYAFKMDEEGLLTRTVPSYKEELLKIIKKVRGPNYEEEVKKLLKIIKKTKGPHYERLLKMIKKQEDYLKEMTTDKPRKRKSPITWKWDLNYDYIFGRTKKKK